MADHDLPDLDDIAVPQLEPWERMAAAGHRLRQAASVPGLPGPAVGILCAMSAGLADEAETHRTKAVADHRCGVEDFADALLGMQVHRG